MKDFSNSYVETNKIITYYIVVERAKNINQMKGPTEH